jgi:predicted Holliday junction resolvase-like endonuclease
MKKIKNSFKSVRMRLFFTLCTVIIFIIVILIMINNIVLETFYIYSKTSTIKNLYEQVNDYYKDSSNQNIDLEDELKNTAIKNNIDILIKEGSDTTVITTNKDFLGVARKNKY